MSDTKPEPAPLDAMKRGSLRWVATHSKDPAQRADARRQLDDPDLPDGPDMSWV